MKKEKRRKIRGSCVLFYCLLFSGVSVFSQTRYYVSITGSSTGNALSWATACNDLQLVINKASNGDTIWVAQGVYIPVRPADSLWKIDPSDRRCGFVVTKNLHLFGGFIGFETDINQRNLPAQGSGNITIISGDVGIQGDDSDNLPQLFIALDADSLSVDGFTFKDGGKVDTNDRILTINNKFIMQSSTLYSSVAIYNLCSVFNLTHCSVCNNISYRVLYSNDSTCLYISKSVFHNNNPYGSVIQSRLHSRLYIDNTTFSDNGYCSNPPYLYPLMSHLITTQSLDFVSLTNVHINGNAAVGGGGIELSTAASQLTNVYFSNDTANWGGGISVVSAGVPVQRHIWTNLSFTHNISTWGGGIYFVMDSSHTLIAHLTNIRITNNQSGWGGGINFGPSNYFVQINNATIANNTGGFGGGIDLSASKGRIEIRNSIISGNKDIYHGDSIKTTNSIYGDSCHCLSFSNSLVEGWKGTAGVILDTFPMFADTANGNFHLLPNSPAVNVGNKLIYSPDSSADISWITVDLDSLPRICDGEIDLGCYEAPGYILPYLFFSHTIRVCAGDSVVIPLRLLGTPPWNIVYTTNGQQYDTVKNITDNPYYFQIKPLETTIYRFISISDSLYNVPFSDSLTVFVLQRPVVNMEDSIFLCNWDTITVSPSVTHSDRYLWSTGNTKKDISISRAGTYRLTASNEICSTIDSVIAIQIYFQNFQLLTTGDLCAEGTMELTTNKEDVDHLWSTGETSPTIQVKEDGIYKVSVTAGNCHAEDSLTIYCPCKVTMYNFFTPNGDGFNDIYLPGVESTLNDFSMSIYNRWGELVFQTKTYTGWNGYINNVPAKEGVYFAVVQYTCQNKPEIILTDQSSVTLAR